MLCWYSQLRTESSCCCQWTHCLDPAARSWSSWSPHWLADSGDWCCWARWCSEWLCSIFLLHLLQPHLRWLWDVSLLCSVEKIGIDAFSGYPAIKYNLFWHRFVGLSHVCSYLSQEAGCTQQQDCGTSLTWKLTLFNLFQSNVDFPTCGVHQTFIKKVFFFIIHQQFSLSDLITDNLIEKYWVFTDHTLVSNKWSISVMIPWKQIINTKSAWCHQTIRRGRKLNVSEKRKPKI